ANVAGHSRPAVARGHEASCQGRARTARRSRRRGRHVPYSRPTALRVARPSLPWTNFWRRRRGRTVLCIGSVGLVIAEIFARRQRTFGYRSGGIHWTERRAPARSIWRRRGLAGCGG